MVTATGFAIKDHADVAKMDDAALKAYLAEINVAFVSEPETGKMAALLSESQYVVTTLRRHEDAVTEAAERAALEGKLPEILPNIRRAVVQGLEKIGIKGAVTFRYNPKAEKEEDRLTVSLGSSSAPRAAGSGNGGTRQSGPRTVSKITSGAAEKYPSVKVGETYDPTALRDTLGIANNGKGAVNALNAAGIHFS